MSVESQNEDPGNDNGSVGDGLTAESDSATTPSANLSDIASHFATSMPQVQDHAIQKANDDAVALANGPTDRAGARFDPAIHAAGPDGKGILTVRGTWSVKRGRKASTGNVANAQPSSTLATPNKPVDAKKAADDAASRNAGIAAAGMFIVAMRAVGGEEFTPVVDEKTGHNEPAMLQGAFADYFAATGKKDIPPGAALSFAILAYIAPRLFMPQTKARLSTFKSKIVQWWVNRKLRKQGLTATVSANGDTSERRKEA